MKVSRKISEEPVHILIAEDSPTQAARLKHTLESHGYQVTAAVNGRQAMEMARAHLPTLVMSDIVMPEMNGYQLCQQMKADPYFQDVPVILVTSLADPEDVIRGLECGADNFIVKPYDERYLMSRIQFILLNNRKNLGVERLNMAVEIHFNNQRHVITADRLQILNLLLSTYEAAIERNRELARTKEELHAANAALESANKDLGDINERLRVEIAERELAERQLNTLNNEVLAAMKMAAAANQAKSAFLANMGHEIRTPVEAIMGHADIALDAAQSQDDRSLSLHAVRRNGEHLLILINDILDLSKIEAGKLVVDRADCSPCRVLQEVAALMGPPAAEKQLQLEISNDGPVPLTIQSDAARLRQILLNLVSNAIKFTQTGGVRINLRLQESPGTPLRLRFDVTDTGIGMTTEQLDKLFQPFAQADDSIARQFGGIGLGLAISKGLAEMLGGRIEASSSPGQGTTLSLIIDPGSLEGIRRIASYSEVSADGKDAPVAPPSLLPV